MLGFKRFRSAATTISSIASMHRIRKGQFGLDRFRLQDTTTPAIWNAVLAAQYGILICWHQLAETIFLHQSR
jgi:hypothetical protein